MLPKGKWGVAYTAEIPLIDAGTVNYAASGDVTLGAGDVKVVKDGGSPANIGTLPSAVTSGNGSYWTLSLSATEMQCVSRVAVTIIDAATKAIEDQMVVIEMDYGVRSNTAQAGGNTSITLDASASAVANFYVGLAVELIGGTGAGQFRIITAYDESTKVATVHRAWATNPDNTSIFRLKDCLEADVRAISGDSTAADNAESFFDGTGYAGTGNVIPSVTAVGSVSGAVGSVTGNVGGSVGSLAAQAKADVNAEVDTALSDYDPPTRTEATSDKAEILAAIPTPPTASAIADQVWDETLSGHLTAGSTGAALNAANAPTAAAVADAVWDEALSGHATAGTAGKALSDAATGGTVTISYSQVALALAAAVSAGTITLRRGDRISLQITGLGALPAGRDKLWFTVKSAPVSQADSASIIQVTETGGLLYLNGAVPSDNGLTSADGSLTVDDATDGDVTLVLSAAASALLVQKQSLTYDLQYQDGSTVTTLAQGVANVVVDVTRAVS